MQHSAPNSEGRSAGTGSISASLLERVKAHDQAAWQRLVNLYSPLVYRWCRCWGVHPSGAPDIVQDVFLAVVSGIAGFRRDRAGDTFRGWLWTIARNEVRDHFARRGKRPQAVGGTGHQMRLVEIPERYPEDVDDSDVGNETIGLLRRVLHMIRGDFQERTWQVFWRTTIKGEATADIAKDLGMTKRAVRQAKHRVLQRLREEFRELID